MYDEFNNKIDYACRLCKVYVCVIDSLKETGPFGGGSLDREPSAGLFDAGPLPVTRARGSTTVDSESAPLPRNSYKDTPLTHTDVRFRAGRLYTLTSSHMSFIIFFTYSFFRISLPLTGD